MKRLMVKPTPQSRQTPKNCFQLDSAGRRAPARRISSQDAPNTPTALPSSNPAAMPRGTVCSKVAGVTPCSDTPAFTNANMGSTAKATQGCKACSALFRGEPPLASDKGMASAVATPASVA